ncbi:hypothetical protein Cob_v011548 [Colletotrichum orbiculare MAFF 240422]|uniref:Uncharacterized protein n=1 Tax=Colletotrichum orbiculare (strain 104-T / ATCC 96160 / CBS 514.97 / LARS 414 / MAFF 240422) TaxID=1213857 RepID=A0A484FAU6_COLOR|nr:hypothetical protein Cob_v011548 [Colletotrichum orbiculare MAFF 240422]
MTLQVYHSSVYRRGWALRAVLEARPIREANWVPNPPIRKKALWPSPPPDCLHAQHGWSVLASKTHALALRN